MSYGATKWASSTGRAPAAATAKRRTTRKRKATTARPATKKRASAARKSKKKAAPRASKPKKKPVRSTRKYVAYDPVTGKKYLMTKDDPRYAEWPHRKPSKKAVAAAKVSAITGISPAASAVLTPVVAKAIEKGGTTAKRTVTKLLAQVAGPALATAGASIGAGAATTAALALSAGLAGYWLTSAVLNQGATIDARKRAVADALRFARADLTSRLGRPPTFEELKPLNQKYKELAAIAASGQNPDSFYRVRG